MADPSNEVETESPEAERERLIAELEKDVRRSGVGVLPPVAGLALLGALFLLFWMRADLEYAFSSRTPIELGAEGDYHFERALTNRYAQVHGVPTVRGWYVDEAKGSFVIVGLSDTPLLVRRVTFADEAGREGKRPQPRQNPFFARGRLLSRTEAVRYQDVFAQYEAWSQTSAGWILLAEDSPGSDRGTFLTAAFLSLFAVVNAWLLVRGLVRPRT